MKQITRAATLTDLEDLLARVPHANLAFETPAGIEAMPVGFQRIEGQLWVGIPRGDGGPSAGSQAMLAGDRRIPPDPSAMSARPRRSAPTMS